ncbi:MAG: hypothetical protein GXO66_02655 [Euryarchaeota archaeon]|nr:hypothetical protein [Euryarchaeota archaeon]
MLEILGHSGPARLGVWHYADKKIPTPNFLLNAAPATTGIKHDAYIAPRWVRTSRAPLVVHYGTLVGGAKIRRQGILPGAGFGLDIPRELAELGVERTLALAERYPEQGAVVEGGRYPDLRELAARRLASRSLLAIASGAKLCRRPRLLVEVLTRVREVTSPNTALYLPGAPPALFPVLAYMGVDLFDASHAIRDALTGRYLTPLLQSRPLDRMRELPCTCPVCTSGGVDALRSSSGHLVRHNIWVLRSLCAQMREAIRSGGFAELLEMLADASPAANAVLRILYREKHPFLEKYTRTLP